MKINNFAPTIFIVVTLALALLFVSGCGDSNRDGSEADDLKDEYVNTGENASKAPAEAVEEAETEDKEKESEVEETDSEVSKLSGIGDTVTKDKYYLTVNSGRWVLSDGPDTPGAGEKWLAITYHIENNSDMEISSSRLVNFNLYNEKGESSDVRLLTDGDTQDDYIEEGQSLQGEIVFIVGEADSTWEFVYNPDASAYPNPGLGKASFEIREEELDQ